jgi:ribonuclease BN (tRNA processing enzyme)
MMTTQIVLLGTGTPNAEPDRSGPSIAVVVNDHPYIIDCGPGVGRRISAAYHNGIDGLAMPRITRAFLTHLHSDHTVGFADLIFTAWTLGRTEPLVVYGPKGVHSMSEHILAAYELDIMKRVQGLEPTMEDGYRVEPHEILKPGQVYEDSYVRVEAFPTQHGLWVEEFHGTYPCLGYRFISDERTIVISGDTCPYLGQIEHYRNCDVLIHEVYSAAALKKREKKWQQYHSQAHTSTIELAKIANAVRPGLLVLVHQLHWDASEEDLLGEIETLYDGRVVYGRDLDVY